LNSLTFALKAHVNKTQYKNGGRRARILKPPLKKNILQPKNKPMSPNHFKNEENKGHKINNKTHRKKKAKQNGIV
jgi:hypothetical protein